MNMRSWLAVITLASRLHRKHVEWPNSLILIGHRQLVMAIVGEYRRMKCFVILENISFSPATNNTSVSDRQKPGLLNLILCHSLSAKTTGCKHLLPEIHFLLYLSNKIKKSDYVCTLLSNEARELISNFYQRSLTFINFELS